MYHYTYEPVPLCTIHESLGGDEQRFVRVCKHMKKYCPAKLGTEKRQDKKLSVFRDNFRREVSLGQDVVYLSIDNLFINLTS